jgi:hypothetical protein
VSTKNYGAAFAPNGDHVAVLSGGLLNVFDATTGDHMGSFHIGADSGLLVGWGHRGFVVAINGGRAGPSVVRISEDDLHPPVATDPAPRPEAHELLLTAAPRLVGWPVIIPAQFLDTESRSMPAPSDRRPLVRLMGFLGIVAATAAIIVWNTRRTSRLMRAQRASSCR